MRINKKFPIFFFERIGNLSKWGHDMRSKLDNHYVKVSSTEAAKRQNFGKEFADIRKGLGISIKSFAKELDISADMAKRIEEGLVSPDLPGLQKRIAHMKVRSKMVIA